PAPLAEAARLMATTPRRLDHARIAELAALARRGTDEGARTLAAAALRGYAEIGADHDVARARAAFRRARIPVPSLPRTRPTSGWESLTRTETRIAGRVATGATNPEIAQALSVSRRTVETHVSNVLAKLGLRSRTELAVFVARRLDDVGEHRQ
ncbi:MAG: helix-turn-helix transcriptional regulator, partial [Microbacterium sp.]